LATKTMFLIVEKKIIGLIKNRETFMMITMELIETKMELEIIHI
jgi:hypothetical protein